MFVKMLAAHCFAVVQMLWVVAVVILVSRYGLGPPIILESY